MAFMLWSPIIGSTFQKTLFLSLSLQDIWITAYPKEGFPDSSVGKESTSSARDLGLIPGLGRCPGEGIGYLLQYSWAALVAQLVKNLPAMWETWVWSLGWEDPLEKGEAAHSTVLAWRIPWTIQSTVLQRVGRDWATFTFPKKKRKTCFFLILWVLKSLSLL